MKFNEGIEDPAKFIIAAGMYLASAPVDVGHIKFDTKEQAEQLVIKLLKKNHTIGLQLVDAATALLREPGRTDEALLNHNIILMKTRDEFGEPASIIYSGIDLRAAIRAGLASAGLSEPAAPPVE